MAILNFGSINIDHVYTLPHFVAPGETLSSTQYECVLGGKGANQSIACAMAGSRVFHIGNVNANDQKFVDQIKQAGVDCQHVNFQDIASGHAIIQVNEQGENAILLFSGANFGISHKQINQALMTAQSSDWILLQNETNSIEDIINAGFEKNIPVAFNPAPMTDAVKSLAIEKVSLLIVNEVEAIQLCDCETIEDAISTLKQRYPNTKILLTLGKRGALFMHSGKDISMPSFKVETKDTTAAGDTFIGFFLSSASEALNEQSSLSSTQREEIISSALKIACAAAAISVTREGAAPSIPKLGEVTDFIEEQSN